MLRPGRLDSIRALYEADADMRVLAGLLLFALAPPTCAQTIFRDDEHLASDRPEAWAMNYFAASTFMTSFGEAPRLDPGHWDAALELGHIPALGERQRAVGFDGFKLEDLNRSPVFGRWRLRVGLPGGWVAELGHTPPVSVEGVRPRDLVALAIGHRLIERGQYTLSARVFGLHGSATGDITCPASLAGLRDGMLNPYGCQAPSNDRLVLHHYGIDLTSGWHAGRWRWHGSLGVARTELEVQVDAHTFDVRDRSRLVARGVLPFAAIGTTRDITPQWALGIEVLHVPISVRREAGAPDNDPLTSLRLQLRWQRP